MFEQLANEHKDGNSDNFLEQKDHTDFDVRFISVFLSRNTNWLDEGSRSGLIINRFYQKVKQVTCIEPVKKYGVQIVKAENVKVVNSTFDDFCCEIFLGGWGSGR